MNNHTLTWRKSTYSSDSANCVEVAWRSPCQGGSCVEVAHDTVCNRVLVRDSKLGDTSPVLSFTPAGWSGFLYIAEWDRTSRVTLSGISVMPVIGGTAAVCLADEDGHHLHLTTGEWDAFVAGIRDRQFDIDRVASASA